MKKKTRNIIVVALVALAAAITALYLPRLLRVDFRARLAKQLNVDPNFLHLNVPPSPQRYPGFAFVVRGTMLPLISALDRKDLSEGPAFELEWTELAKNDATANMAGGPFKGLFSSDTGDNVSLSVRGCRVLEADVSKLKSRLLSEESVLKQADSGTKVLMIVRAYEGQLEMKVRRGAKAQAGVWAEKVKVAKGASAAAASGDINVSTADEDQVVIQWSKPVVFAFEAVEAKLFAGHLGGKPDKVDLVPLTTSDLLRMATPQAGMENPSDLKKKD